MLDVKTCKICKAYVILTSVYKEEKYKADGLCYDCRCMKNDNGEVDHHDYIRCPKCKNVVDAYEVYEGELNEEGEHEAWCDECNHEYTISTRVEFTFTSPALLKKDFDSNVKNAV